MVKKFFAVFALIFGGLVMESSIPLPKIILAQAADPVFVGAGDIANCSRTEDESTAKLLDNISGTVFTLGDNVYPDGTTTQFNNCYNPTWGRHKSRTKPSVGNHDYHTSGAAGYYAYFGTAASPLDNNCTSNCKGYYSYNLGAWHIIVLNSEISAGAGSAQEQWLRSDLAANQNTCTLAYWHKPRFSSGQHGNITSVQAFWQALYDYGADVVLNGHDHTYERFAPQNPSGQADSSRGIREFVAGTGGASLYSFPTIRPNSQVRNNTTWGVLKLTLHATSYDWQFVPIAGQTFTDSGSANCVGTGAVPTATRTRTPTPGPTPTRTRTPTPGPTPTRTPTSSGSDLIFADGFESGNLSAWSSSTTNNGNLSVTAAAALIGSFGMQAVINDNNLIYVTDNSPNAEPRYRVRFYFDPNSIGMAGSDAHFIFDGLMGSSTKVLRVEFHKSSGNYQLRARLLNDNSTWINTNWFTVNDAPHSIEMDWKAATAAGANDGSLTFWIDSVQQANLTGVNNDTHRIDGVRLGAANGIDSGTRGTYYFDAFDSRRQTFIGAGNSAQTLSTEPDSTLTNTPTPSTEPSTPLPIDTATPTFLPTTLYIGDLDGTSSDLDQGSKWIANVTITVHDTYDNPVVDATVSGSWSNGADGLASCTTGSNGQCSVSIGDIPYGNNGVTFTVNNVIHATMTYTLANNHDPDGDSNGSEINISRP